MTGPHRLRGFTLVEVLVTLSIGSVVMLLGAQMLIASMKLSKRAGEERQRCETLSRLASQFRQDAHLAIGTSIESPESIRFDLADLATVEYDLSEQGVLKRVYRSAESDVSIPEAYRLGEKVHLVFEQMKEPNRVRMLVGEQTGLEDPAVRIDRSVEPVLGLLIREDPMTTTTGAIDESESDTLEVQETP